MTTEQLVRQIHETPIRVVLAIAGGGSRAIADLMEAPGASRTMLEAVVPYSEKAMTAWLGGQPDQFCSEPTGRAIAMAAYLRARRLDDDSSLAGVACTASLATNRPKRGAHRAYVAIQTAASTMSQSIELQKGRRSRAEEERLVARMIVNAVAEVCGVEQRLELDLFPGERIEEARIVAPESWQRLLAGEVSAVCEGKAASPQARPQTIFPGAFNPMHAGHRRMAEVARERLGVPVEFEISIVNVDKPPLDYLEISRRLELMGEERTVWLTRCATFDSKSAHFPGATFVVGADTIRRIADPRYYGGDPAACHASTERIRDRGCRFLVFGRSHGGQFVSLADLSLPNPLREISSEVPAEEFREDISSTDIRRCQEAD